MKKVFNTNMLYVNYEIIILSCIISSFQLFLDIKFKKVSKRKFHFHCIDIFQMHLQMHQIFLLFLSINIHLIIKISIFYSFIFYS